jgi:hypothetical protein
VTWINPKGVFNRVKTESKQIMAEFSYLFWRHVLLLFGILQDFELSLSCFKTDL